MTQQDRYDRWARGENQRTRERYKVMAKPYRPCINPKASEAGWIVSFCDCPLCSERKKRKEQEQEQSR
jgi:hypothetical protein